MRCPDCQESISALADGEASELEQAAVTTHLRECASCRDYYDRVQILNRQLRIGVAEPIPDLRAGILAAARPLLRSRAPRQWPRYALLWVGLVQIALAVPPLFGTTPGATVHLAREVGSWDVALGVGLLVAAWQPRRALGLLPMAAALTGAMALTGVLDVIAGRVSAGTEAQHCFDLIGLAALWLTAHPGPISFRIRTHLRLA